MIQKLYKSLLLRLLVIFLFSFSVAGIVIYYSFQESLWESIQRFDMRLLFIGVLMIAISWVLDGFRLQNLARAGWLAITSQDMRQLVRQFAWQLKTMRMLIFCCHQRGLTERASENG